MRCRPGRGGRTARPSSALGPRGTPRRNSRQRGRPPLRVPCGSPASTSAVRTFSWRAPLSSLPWSSLSRHRSILGLWRASLFILVVVIILELHTALARLRDALSTDEAVVVVERVVDAAVES